MRAVEQLNLLSAIRLAFADKKDGGPLMTRTLAEAFPGESNGRA